MKLRRLIAVLVAGLGFASRLNAQLQPPVFNRDMVVIDPAHGGSDTGALITDSLSEKDVTMALASRLRSLLTARGFTVVLTRDNANATLSNDQRAELANKAHAVACLVIHASASGNGVHIGTSTLGSSLASIPPAGAKQSAGAIVWDRAQEIYISQSLRLANQVGAAISRSSIPLTTERAALRPLDNLMCPAISIEITLQGTAGSVSTPVSDSSYQQHIADAIAGALLFWRNQAQQPEFITVPRPSSELRPPTTFPTFRPVSGL